MVDPQIGRVNPIRVVECSRASQERRAGQLSEVKNGQVYLSEALKVTRSMETNYPRARAFCR